LFNIGLKGAERCVYGAWGNEMCVRTSREER